MPPLPPPLPPETRTVGQLVAETVRLYRERFWPSLALGIPAAILVQVVVTFPRELQIPVTAGLGSVLLSLSYVGASVLVSRTRPPAVVLGRAYLLALFLFPPAPLFALAFALPGVAWLAFVGLGVPAAVIERSGLKESFRRGIELARVDYVHALGGLAALVIAFFLTRTALVFALRGQAETTIRIAAFLADLVISPVLFLGAALLYGDQRARLDKLAPVTPEQGGEDADVHHAVDADRAGRPDAEVESGSAARGEP